MGKQQKYRHLTGLILALLLLTQLSAHAAGISSDLEDTKNTIDHLQEQQEEQQDAIDSLKDYQSGLSSDIQELNDSLKTLSDSLTELQTKIDDKNNEIAAAQEEIESLTKLAARQYETMKQRIQYTYEHGSTGYIEVLFAAESFADFMNRAEYVKSIHDYDREQLETYRTTLAAIEEKQTAMETARTELEEAQALKQTAKEESEALLAKLQGDIAAAGTQIASAQDNLDATNAELERQKAYEAELEEQKAKEDVDRLDEIKDQESELPDNPPPNTSEGDLALMAAIIECEAGGESYEGKLAVGSVVMNRVDSSYFPNTVMEVLYQKNQFSPVASGRFAAVLARGADESCVQAAAEVLGGARTLNCLYFRRNNGLINGTVIGNHVFY